MKRFLFLFMAVLMMAGTAKADVEWTVWEGSTTKGNVSLSPTNFNGIETGDKICVYGTGTLSKSLNKQTGDKWEWGTISGYSATETGTDANYYHVVDADLVALLGDADLKAFIIGNWDEGTITKVSIKKKTSMIKTVLSDEAKSESTFEYTIPSSMLANLVEGDYLYIAATQQSKEENESYKIEFKDATYWKYYTTIYNCNHDIWWAASSDTVKNHNLYIYGEHYSPTGVYLYHPVPSFSIGSIGYATFSASQEVTAPNTVTAYKATVSGSRVVLSPFTNNVIPANTGAIIAGDEGSVLEFVASSTGSIETSELIACTTATDVSTLTVSDYDLYVLYPGTAESETELSLSTLLGSFGGWNSDIGWDPSTYTVTYSKATGNGEGGWVGEDWSGYDYLRLNFSSNTLNDDATFYVAYQGHDENTTHATLAQGTVTTVNIPLDSDYKNSIGNFSMYSNATSGSLTFESAALIDSDGATVAEFRKTTSGTLAANKAYLKLPSSVNPARLSIVFNDEDSETTGILDVQKHTTQSDNVYYNLRGMQVNKPTKGLYIMNGKKVIVK